MTTLGMYLWAQKFEYWSQNLRARRAATTTSSSSLRYQVERRHGLHGKDVYTTFNIGRLENFTIWQYVDKMNIVDDQTINFHFSRQ